MSSDSPTPLPPPTPPAYTPDENDLKRAFHAFKKRIKVLQLETDSKLGRSHLTGQKETITEIQTPPGHLKEVWRALAARGYIKDEGRGFYKLLKNDW